MSELDYNVKQKIHFTGIGGISMSSLAHILLTKGFTVTGSDWNESDLTRELAAMGATIYVGQRAENITEDIDTLVYTAAVKPDNPELVRAGELGIPCISRADFLGLMMKNYPTAICVSGTHGKTTTTSLVSQILLDAETDPTIMVGGILPSIGGNTRIGGSGYMLAEACEYTNSFLSFFPTIAVILNVRPDHLDFFKDLDDIRHSFKCFADLLPADGTLVINGEIENLSYFTEGLPCKFVTYGIDGDYDYTARNITFNERACGAYDLFIKGEYICHVQLGITGMHNVSNSLAAVAVAGDLGLSIEAACASCGAFTGVDRRFQIKGDLGGVTVVDDYAHHPDEINATMSAALNYPHKKLWVVFQPHTYSRTVAHMDAFAESLAKADAVVLADIYAAREQNTFGISSADLQKKVAELGTPCYYFPSFDEIENFLLENCTQGDVLITMGAGDVVNIGNSLLGL